MRARRALLAGALLTLAVSAGALAAKKPPPAPPKTQQCKRIKNCISVPGPWVAVPAHGEVTYLLECPKRQGIIGGFDALASSKDIRVSWDGKLGDGAVRPGTSTIGVAFFRAESASGQAGSFQPVLGCIPPPKVSTQSPL
jgi:hypothetical protein